jgi:hypothetical protein
MKDKIKVTLGIILIIVIAGLLFKTFLLYRYETAIIQGFSGPGATLSPNINFYRINRITENVSFWDKDAARWVRLTNK